VKTRSEIIKLWTCPKCGRQFERQGQTHSCKPFALEQHFEGKPAGRLLYEEFRHAVKRQVGAFKIESLECCIHFVRTFTFVAIKILKDKIRVDFSLSRKIKSKRIVQSLQMSAQRWLYVIDIMNEDEIDEGLLQWIQEAHDKKLVKAEAA
jgi:hypothetical protein